MHNSKKIVFISVFLSVLISSLLITCYHFIVHEANSNNYMENDELIMKQKKCNLDNIVIEIYDVRNPNFGLTSATFNFVISVYNPNKYAIANPKLSYEAYINGIHVAVGKTMLPDIPSNDNRKYSTSFLLSYIDFGKSLINSIRSGDFELNMKGKIESKGISKRFDIFYKK